MFPTPHRSVDLLCTAAAACCSTAMERPNTCGTPTTSTALLCSLCLSCASVAAPPLLKVASPGRTPSAETFHGAQGRIANSTAGSHERLDLRPPGAGEFAALGAHRTHVDMTSSSETAAAYESKSFPSPHRPTEGPEGANPLPSMGAEAGHPRIMGRAEDFARRFHREGLPIARLWENHSALVSLGLNPKGKPGLWLVQKTH